MRASASGGAGRRCAAVWLGRLGYRDAVVLQESAATALKRAQLGGPPAEEKFFLLEHPPVITLGRNAVDGDVLAGADRLAALGVTVERTNRGGQVTYHGPGQLVGYPILDLTPDRRDVGRYLRDLEEVLIRALARLGLTGRRQSGWTGVWVGEEKVAALGVHLSRWVTTHGFALNVTTDLDHFGLIVPCGIRTRGVTSVARLLGRAVTLEEMAALVVPEFAEVFERTMTAGDGEAPLVTDGPPDRAAQAPRELRA
ncbi:MAG TPA: lipoyl(octanoyl) transferase LipB [Candidatus Polarisedimenticolia bacterium]|nr:lipoyl(octanoyl) transferase LipB [Candidatus Polarisedimenticolia bacterium]